jgi:hypothetical protein
MRKEERKRQGKMQEENKERERKISKKRIEISNARKNEEENPTNSTCLKILASAPSPDNAAEAHLTTSPSF